MYIFLSHHVQKRGACNNCEQWQQVYILEAEILLHMGTFPVRHELVYDDWQVSKHQVCK